MSEIAYTLDRQEIEKTGYVAIRLAELTKEGFTHHLNHPIPSPTLAKWRALASQEKDKQALSLLIKEELAYQQKRTGRAPHAESMTSSLFHIPAAQSVPILNALGATQKLYFNGKQLVVDFIGHVDFYYEITPLEAQRIEVKGRLKWRDTDIELQACDCIGPGKPQWFIRGISLKGISTPLSWKELQRAFQTKPWILEGPHKAAFLEEFEEEDPDFPGLVIKESSSSAQDLYQQTAPLPLLILKDRLGAFADLWMEYGQGLRVALHDPRPILQETQGSIRLKRQSNAEQGFEKDLLETDFIKKAVSTSHYYCPIDKVAKSLTFLLEIGWSIQDWQGNRVVKQDALNLELEDNAQSFKVKGRVRYEMHEADVGAILGAFNRRERFIQLNPGTVGLLPELTAQHPLRELAEEGEIVGQEVRVKKSHFGALSSLFEQAQLPSSLTAFKEKWESFSGIQSVQPSPFFSGTLRPYQQEGLNWLAFLSDFGFHGILADEMGLGKTVQVLAFLSRLPSDVKHLIVVPTSLLFNWKNEIHQFLPHLSCYVHQGPTRAKTIEELKPHSIILISYTTLRLDLPLLQKENFHSVILDEAQVIKNARTQTSQAVCSLQSHFRLCLTGTPIENHMGELWSHFHFLIPDLFGSEESFMADIQAASSDRRYLDRIKKKIAPFVMRRRKQEVAKDLPPRIDQTVWVEMSDEQRALYDRLLAGFKGNLLKKVEVEGMGKHRLEVLEAILRLRQICCHPLLVSSLSEELEENAQASAKFEALTQDLQTIVDEGSKVLVYSQFTSMLQLMTRFAKQQGWSYAYLDGSTLNREKVVTEFQKNATQSIFFISLKAGGVGLNLTAADYVLLYDPWWNEAVEEQAINRAHRIGRQDQVIAKRFVVAESIEEKMMKLKAAKRSLVEDVFDLDTNPAQLTIDDLRFLLD